MKYTNIIRRENKILMVIVAFLVVMVIGSSYALFMKVKSNTTNQVVETGTLEISYESSC